MKKEHWLMALPVLFAVSFTTTRVSGFYAQPEVVRLLLSPAGIVSCEGCGAVKLRCEIPRQHTVANLPDPVLGWLVNNTMISVGVEDFSNSTHVWSILTLPRPTPADSGLYQCSATDGSSEQYCGSDKLPCVTTVALSDEARVQIIRSVEEASSVSLLNCSSTLLSCGSLSGCNECQLYWTKSSIRVNQSENAKVLSDGSLVLSSRGNTEMAGMYQCLVIFTQEGGQPITMTAASYTVNTAQGLSSEHEAMEVASSKTAYFERETVHLVCAHNFNYCPRISWTRDGAPLATNSTILSLHTASVEQSGSYCCRGTPDTGDSLEHCLSVDIYPMLDPLSIESNTVFPDTVNNSIEISTPPLNHTYPLCWYRNGVQISGEIGASLTLEGGEEVYGLYQCFLSVPAHPRVLHRTARVMPSNRVNPPTQPQLMMIVRAANNDMHVAYSVTWERPLYTGNQPSLQYRLQDTFITSFKWNASSNSQEIFLAGGLFIVLNVEVIDSSGSRISDSGASKTEIVPFGECVQTDVLYPPSIDLSCDSGWVSVSLHNNPLNMDGSRAEASVYYIQGSCTGSNGTTVVEEKLKGTSSFRLQFLPNGTHCSLRAAAATGDFATCNSLCSCVDPDLIEFTAPIECQVSGTVSVGFGQDVYEVDEDAGSVQVCVTAQTMEQLQSSVTIVSVRAIGSAAQGSEDFRLVLADLLLLATTGSTMCVNVTIIDDTVLENSEDFFLILSTTDPLIHLNRRETVVRIADNDQLTISLSGPSIISESDSLVQLCIEINGTTERNISVSIDTSSGTASEGRDFIGVHGNFTLTTRQCENVEVLNDSILEALEWFVFSLSSSDLGVTVSGGELQLTIVDDDFVAVSLSLNGSSEVTENEFSEALKVCVEIQGGVERNFSVSIDTLSETAIEGMDFTDIHKELSFTDRVCENLEIKDDSILEDTESFFITLSSTDHSINIIGGKLELIIQDNDHVNISLIQPFNVSESAHHVQLCARIEGVLERTVAVSINTSSETAPGYDGLHENVIFHSESLIECVNISIIDNNETGKTSSFTVILSSSDPAVRVIQERVDVNVLDNDITSTPSHPSETVTPAIVAGVLSGLAFFVALLVLAACVTWTCMNCKYRNMSVAERGNKKAHIKTDDRLELDTEEWLTSIELIHLRKIPEEDSKSEFDTYNSLSGSFVDILALDHSPAPRHTREVMAAGELNSLRDQTEEFLRESLSDTSGVSSTDYIHWRNSSAYGPYSYRTQHSPSMADNPHHPT